MFARILNIIGTAAEWASALLMGAFIVAMLVILVTMPGGAL